MSDNSYNDDTEAYIRRHAKNIHEEGDWTPIEGDLTRMAIMKLKNYLIRNKNLNIPLSYITPGKEKWPLGQILNKIRQQLDNGTLSNHTKELLDEYDISEQDISGSSNGFVRLRPGVVDAFCNRFNIRKSSISMNYRTLEKINEGIPVREFALRDFHRIFSEYAPISYKGFLELSSVDLDIEENKIIKMHNKGDIYDLKRFSSDIFLEDGFSPDKVFYHLNGHISSPERKILLSFEREINNIRKYNISHQYSTSLSAAFEQQDNLEILKNIMRVIDDVGMIKIYYAVCTEYQLANYKKSYSFVVKDDMTSRLDNSTKRRIEVPIYEPIDKKFYLYITTSEELTNHKLLVNNGLPFSNRHLHKIIQVNQKDCPDPIHIGVHLNDLLNTDFKQVRNRLDSSNAITKFIDRFEVYGISSDQDEFNRELYIYPRIGEIPKSWNTNNNILTNYA